LILFCFKGSGEPALYIADMNSTTLPPLKPRSKLYAAPTVTSTANTVVAPTRNLNNSSSGGGLQIQQLYDNSTLAATVAVANVTNKAFSLSNPAVNTLGSNTGASILHKSPSVDSVGSYKSSSVNQNSSTVMKRQSLNIMTPEQSMKNYMQKLSAFEHHEIFNYQEIYFVGQNAKKIQGRL
jgi:dual specificity tyrosine-phosphorylation-regulated kinase 2/3/4